MELETIKDKLRKLQALVEHGYEGEAKTAKLMLDKLCKQYGVRLEDVLDTEKTERYHFKTGRGRIWKGLLFQCYGFVTGKRKIEYSTSSILRDVIYIELTAYQYAEISNLFEWHRANLRKDLKAMEKLAYEAYVQKHQLVAPADEDAEGEEDETIDFAYLQRLMVMMSSLGDNRYHKQIESH